MNKIANDIAMIIQTLLSIVLLIIVACLRFKTMLPLSIVSIVFASMAFCWLVYLIIDLIKKIKQRKNLNE